MAFQPADWNNYNGSGYYLNTYPAMWSSSTSAATWQYTQPAVAQPHLPYVAEAPAELSDREWLDAQVDEVCLLAA